jgi:hypothetical protein
MLRTNNYPALFSTRIHGCDGMQVLTALATACDNVAIKVLDAETLKLLGAMITHGDDRVCCASLMALSNLAFPAANKAVILAHLELMDLVQQLASPATGCKGKVTSPSRRANLCDSDHQPGS